MWESNLYLFHFTQSQEVSCWSLEIIGWNPSAQAGIPTLSCPGLSMHPFFLPQMDTYSTEMLKLSPHADICWCSPCSLQELCLFRQKCVKTLLVKETAFYTYLCRFASTFSKVNKIDVELTKKFIPLITSGWAGAKPDEFRERKKLRSVDSYLWCSGFVVFLKGEMSCSTQDLNHKKNPTQQPCKVLYVLQLL